ncbi:MAG: hypothetical protein ACKO10_01285 [Betaproteobacteria bacterium]
MIIWLGGVMRLPFLLLLFSLYFSHLSHADDRIEHGDWASQFREGMGEASTHDNGTAMFGMLCADRLCRYYFANGTPCEAGNNYPIMLTTKVGALALDSVCEPMQTANGEVMLYWFGESAQLNDAFSQSESVGFAFPLTSGHFRTNVFSMSGYSEAIGRMVGVLLEQQDQSPQDQPQQEAGASPVPEEVPDGEPVPTEIEIKKI